MTTGEKLPFQLDEDAPILGYVAKDATGWIAQTIFGYTIARTTDQQSAEAVLIDRGKTYLSGVWQYLDRDDRNWYPCTIQEAHENKVIVIRTNEIGYQTPEDYKHVTIENPTDEVLVKG